MPASLATTAEPVAPGMRTVAIAARGVLPPTDEAGPNIRQEQEHEDPKGLCLKDLSRHAVELAVALFLLTTLSAPTNTFTLFTHFHR